MTVNIFRHSEVWKTEESIKKAKHRYFATLSMTLNILRHSEGFIPKNLFQYAIKKMLKRVQHDRTLLVTLNCLGFCFTKSRYSLLFAVVCLTFCSFVSVLSLRTTQNPLVSGAILKDTSLRSEWRKRCRHTEALAEVSFFYKGNPRHKKEKKTTSAEG